MFNKLIRGLAGAAARRQQADRAETATIADPLLQADVWQGLVVADMLAVGAESAAADPCHDRRQLVRVDVLHAPQPAPDTPAGWGGPWAERWILDRCGVEVAYVVDFSPAGDGGTDWSLRDTIDAPMSDS